MSLVVLALPSLACRKLQNPTEVARPVESPDYAVYSAVLEGLWPSDLRTGGPARYVLDTSTVVGERFEANDGWIYGKFGPQLASLVDATRSDYIARSLMSVRLDLTAMRVHGHLAAFDRRMMDSIPRTPGFAPGTDYWEAFYERYPGSVGAIAFSRPGYDASGSHALLYYSHDCGPMCADSGFVLLERQGNRWTIIRRVVTVVS